MAGASDGLRQGHRQAESAVKDGVVVLMYHRLGQARNAWERKYCVAPDRFAAQMEVLAAEGRRAVELQALVDWLQGGPALPAGSIVITFDDGFRGVREHALPVLERLGWPFTVFLVSDLIGREDLWTLPENPAGIAHPLLDADEIRDMQRRGVRFESHTRSHARLPTLDAAALADQLAGSREQLSELLGREVRYLAYPYGEHDPRVEAAARSAGYRAAFSTRPGFNRADVDHFRIRRLDVYGTDTPAMLLRKVHLGSNDGSLAHATGYYLDRVRARVAGGAR
jgi:peptidoglycan/xylan/chitin deacetylase (PgdA/CDA1 family)